ncbi:mechanosensitive ion channel family protein [Plebeiibacterium sediminum]|uniref:Mechanosensitive ion channel family protein n=1 Tax=Plebeiibacterium sediminum TaxID=2992112 RepID=A0AAE3M785_9BACT|nr:mechanosensitive ion channel family protein [Plebeiobacterium sediminum]MCW3788202.1 mechanosensitive ion channel family protein [Plebeiobacterium sediminum]
MNKEILIELFEKLQKWLLTELPVVIGLTVLLILSLKIFTITINKITKTLIKKAGNNNGVDVEETEKRINTLMGIIRGVVKIILIVTYAIIVLEKLGLNIAPILASAGIIGLAVGFGAQELVRDVISGFFILLEDQIRTGDVAIINGTEGWVEKIELRTITLRDISGIVHIFQNGKINTLSNRTKEWSAAVFDVGVAYKEDVSEVMSIIKEVGDELKSDVVFQNKIIEPIEILGLDQFADSALVIKARIKTKPSQQWAVKREFNKRLKISFDERKIEIPFPHTTIYWGEKISPLNLNVNNNKTN